MASSRAASESQEELEHRENSIPPHWAEQALPMWVSTQRHEMQRCAPRVGEGSYCMSTRPSKRIIFCATSEQYPVIPSSREICSNGSHALTKQISTSLSCEEEQVKERDWSDDFIAFWSVKEIGSFPLYVWMCEEEQESSSHTITGMRYVNRLGFAL